MIKTKRAATFHLAFIFQVITAKRLEISDVRNILTNLINDKIDIYEKDLKTTEDNGA